MSKSNETDTHEMHRAPAADIEDVRVEDEMEQSYIDYSMSVIAGRALPDVRDGLKPVQRRILYAMDEMGLTSGGSHRKSSSIVGETMGNYHPHGDKAIYDALVRMAQDFSLRYPVVDGQGNFGSIDGDPPAAMRYTEARPESLASDLLDDIDKDTVDWTQNYDDRLEEPDVLPAAFPQLLVNGASGIAVGMSTNIPPHNLGEVIDATLHLIDNPEATPEDLMEHVKGPDFPTGATIVGRQGIKEAYTTGRGRVRIRAKYDADPDENQIVITEIPFQQDKSKLVEKIASYVKDGVIEGIRDLRDESDQHGVRIVLDLKRDAIIDVVENQLIQHVLEKTFGVINLALVDGQPQVLTLDSLLQEYLSHRRDVVRRRTNYLLDEAQSRSHILEGRLVAVENADSVIELIQDAADRSAAKLALQEEYDMSEEQAQHVVRMQLGSLTSAEVGEIEEEHEQVRADIERYEEILADSDVLDAVIKEELADIKERYADERRTNIIEDTGSVTNEDLIPEEDILIALSESGYVKRMSQDVVSAQGRGGKGVIGADLRGGDTIEMLHATSTHDHLLFFTNHGNVHFAKGYEMNEVSRTARGTPLVNHFDLDDGEEITALTSVGTFDNAEDKSLVLATKNGYVKRTALDEYSSLRSTGLRAATLDGGDEIVAARVIEADSDLMLSTTAGKTIRFAPEDAREMGRTSRGVNGIKLSGDAEVVSLVEADDDATLFTITENGYGKRTDFNEYRQQSRYGQGIIDIKTDGRNGSVVATRAVTDSSDIVLMTEQGQLIRVDAEEISTVSRNTMGVTIMNLEGDDLVGAVDIIDTTSGSEDDE